MSSDASSNASVDGNSSTIEQDTEKDLHLTTKFTHDTEKLGTIQSANDPAHNAATDLVTSNKQGLGAYQAAIIFITNEIGIGILSLPSALRVLGIVPGVIAIIGMGLLSLYTAHILVQFYKRYPYVVDFVSYGRVLGGKPLELVFAVGFIINLSLICASALITMSIGLNTITDHAVCTVAFVAIPAIICWLICIPRTMKFVAWCGWPCTVSIVSAVLIVVIALGVAGPQDTTTPIRIVAVGSPTFTQAVSAYLNIAFAYTGNQAFPTVLVQMRDPIRDFPKAICIEKCVAILMYTVVAVVCYGLAGDQVTSPAIGSAPVTIAKISYGIIFISLFGTGLVFGHTATKYLYVVVMRRLQPSYRSKSIGAADMPDRFDETESPSGKKSKTSWTVWTAMATVYWILVFIIANAVPILNSLLNISASVLLVWFTWGLPSICWLHLNWNRLLTNWRKKSLLALNIFILIMTLFLNTGGLYASIDTLLGIFADPNNDINGPFTCADNSII